MLDLYCAAGGSARGYGQAGFETTGVDILDQPNYSGDHFVQGDAVEYLKAHWREFDVVHASPPCQAFTAYRRRPDHVAPALNLIPATREALIEAGLPYVIENVPGAPLLDPITLCGSAFGLDVRRHRLFESSFPMVSPGCDHSWQTPRFPQATNRVNLRSTVEVGVYRIPLAEQKRAMGVDWDVTLHELSQMVPPAYSRWIGARLMEQVGRE
jgi:DNA (cytosine-5)-methyltransferase 1